MEEDNLAKIHRDIKDFIIFLDHSLENNTSLGDMNNFESYIRNLFKEYAMRISIVVEDELKEKNTLPNVPRQPPRPAPTRFKKEYENWTGP